MASSQSANKGWITRRANYVRQGKMTVAEFEEIYGTSIGELTDIFDEYSVEFEQGWTNPKTGAKIWKYEIPEEMFDSSENEENMPNIREISDSFIIERINEFTNTTNLGRAALQELQHYKSEDEAEYYRAIADNQADIQTILDNGDLDYNPYQSAVLLGDLIEILSRGAISSNEFQLRYKQAKRDDAFNMYHKKNPNAKYGKRRSGGGFYPT